MTLTATTDRVQCDGPLLVDTITARGADRTRHVHCNTCGLDDTLPADDDMTTGLDYLTPHYPPTADDDEPAVMPAESFAYEVAEITLEAIAANPNNPRRDVGDVTELAAAIASVGLLEPLVVVPADVYWAASDQLATSDEPYVLIAGHRRKAACAIAGLTTATCIIRQDLTGDQARIAMLVENLQRVDLAIFEEANAYAQLVDLGLTQRDIAKRVGRTQPHVSKRLGLLKLPEPVRDMVNAGDLGIGDALEVVAIADHPKQAIEAAKKAGQYGGVAAAVKNAAADIRIDEETKAATARAKDAHLRIIKGPQYGSYWGYGEADTRAWLDDLVRDKRVKHADHIHMDCHAVCILVDGYGDGRKVKTREVCTKPKSHKSKRDKDKNAEEQARKAAEAAERAAVEHARAERRANRLTIVQRTVAGRIGRDVEEYALDSAVELALRTTTQHGHPRKWEGACEVLDIDLFDVDEENLPTRAGIVRDRLEAYARQSISHRTRTVAVLAAMAVDDEIDRDPDVRYYGHQVNEDDTERYRAWLLEHGWIPAPEEQPIVACRQCESLVEDGCGEDHPGGTCPGWPEPKLCCECQRIEAEEAADTKAREDHPAAIVEGDIKGTWTTWTFLCGCGQSGDDYPDKKTAKHEADVHVEIAANAAAAAAAIALQRPGVETVDVAGDVL